MFAKCIAPPEKKTGVRDHVSLQGRALNLALPIVFVF